jgi:hypothetical protein
MIEQTASDRKSSGRTRVGAVPAAWANTSRGNFAGAKKPLDFNKLVSQSRRLRVRDLHYRFKIAFLNSQVGS